jgi:FAD/FMN-containing dehydrogenase/Fe-S oxidoreductase
VDPERARIQEDLRGLLDGDVHCDDVFLQMYASDASIYEIKPLGVVRPRSTDDVVKTVKYAAGNHLSIHPRGAGTSVAGASLGPGLILDFSYRMRRLLAIGKDTIRIQPGIVLAELNRQLARHDQMFGPDPALRSVTTMGSVLSLNASGSHWPAYGEPRDKVVSLKVVLADGAVIQLSSRDANTSDFAQAGADRVSSLKARVADVVFRRQEVIQRHRPDGVVNHAGYCLDGLVDNNQVDLTRLLVGSEGTLGIITEATLRTDPIPNQRGVILIFFRRMEVAAKLATEIAEIGVSACDLMDRRLLSIARETDSRFERMIPPDAEAMLLVEVQGETLSQLRERMQKVTSRVNKRRGLALDVRSTSETNERNLYWRLTRRVIPTLYRFRGQKRALPFVEDIAVPPEHLAAFLVQAYAVLNEVEVTASIFAHAAQGHLHIRPFLDLGNPNDIGKMTELATRLYDRVMHFGGTVSGGHGDGLSRTWFLRQQYGKLYEVFKEIKRIFDPQNILNPGKIIDEPRMELTEKIRLVQPIKPPEPEPTGSENVAADDSATLAGNGQTESKPAEPIKSSRRKASKSKPVLPILTPRLNWTIDDIAQTARDCNGCGRCRTESDTERMCPIFRLAPREEASPRAKANLVRGILTGQLDPKLLTQDELKSVADLCVNCHQCRLECPANVDIPKLMIETKAQYVSVNGLKFSESILTRLDLLYETATYFPRLTNWMIQNRFTRWILDRFFGIAQGRKLPKFSGRSYTRIASRQRLNRQVKREGRKVLYFVDAFANWNDVELARSVVAVLRHNGFDVYVPPNQNVSGMSLITDGLIDRAKKIAAKNVEMLAEAARQGYQIVTTEPSATLCLKHEYLHLFDDVDTKLVAESTIDACQLLWQMHQVGELELDFKPINTTVGYHLPCHQRALGYDQASIRLLKLIPGLQVELLDKGCSGMAGIYGLKSSNFRRSLRAGRELIAAIRSSHDIVAGTTECSTCKIQMEQGTSKPTIHPIKFLALAYGLLPELKNLLERRSGDRVIS